MPRGKYQRKKNQELTVEQPAPPANADAGQMLAKESKRFEDGVRDVPNEIIDAIFEWSQATRRADELHSKFSHLVVDQKWENIMELIKSFGNP